MSVTPNLCCDKTKNRGTYIRVTLLTAFSTHSNTVLFRCTSHPIIFLLKTFQWLLLTLSTLSKLLFQPYRTLCELCLIFHGNLLSAPLFLFHYPYCFRHLLFLQASWPAPLYLSKFYSKFPKDFSKHSFQRLFQRLFLNNLFKTEQFCSNFFHSVSNSALQFT